MPTCSWCYVRNQWIPIITMIRLFPKNQILCLSIQYLLRYFNLDQSDQATFPSSEPHCLPIKLKIANTGCVQLYTSCLCLFSTTHQNKFNAYSDVFLTCWSDWTNLWHHIGNYLTQSAHAICHSKNVENVNHGRTHTRQSVPRLSTFDSQSPVCLTNVSAPFRARARHALSALARLEEASFSAGTERWHRCECLWRIHLKFRQTTAYKVCIKSSGKIWDRR